MFIPQKSLGDLFPSVKADSFEEVGAASWQLWQLALLAPFNFLQQLQVNRHCSKSSYTSDMGFGFCHPVVGSAATLAVAWWSLVEPGVQLLQSSHQAILS